MAMTDITSKAPPTGQPGQRGQIVTIGQAVGQAEAVLTRLLARVLAETRTSRQDYLALQRLAALGGVASREEYITDLSGALYIDLWSAGELVDSLAQAGLLEASGGIVRFALSGTELRDHIARSASALTRTMIAPVKPADLATTIRTLEQVTVRGRALLEGSLGEAAHANR
jgi:DNA-binding MarR family transcriptional regulator